MILRKLGKTGLSISPVTYGAMEIGEEGDLTPSGASKSLFLALEKGINTIDTARAYGPSESIVGQTLREWKEVKPFVFTKIAPLPSSDWRNYVPISLAFSPQSIRDSVDASLKALQMECLDLVQLHQWYYPWTHEPKWLETMLDLKRQGKVAHFGISAQDHEHDAVLQAVDKGLVDTVQFVFNIFESRPLASLVPLAEKRGVGLIGRCILDSGGLSGTLTDQQIAEHKHLKKGPANLYSQRLQILKRDFSGITASLSELAIRFALTSPAIPTIALSMPNAARVEANIAAASKGPLPEETFAILVKRYSWVKNFWNESVYDCL